VEAFVAGRTREVALAVLGLAAFGAVVTVFGALRDDAAPVTPVAGPAATAPAAAGVDPNAAPGQGVPGPGAVAVLAPPATRPDAPVAQPPQVEGVAPAAKPADPLRPSFDVVRVEPTGESVIAGRAAPGATIELLRDGKVHDRTVADGAGLFAFVPPPFPVGPSEVSLRAVPADGTAAVSEQSVTVVVAPRRDQSPVVALATPGAPTAILSTPAAPAAPAPAEGGVRPTVQVETVEAEDGGRLYVSGRAAPGAMVRLYLNESLVASGAATPEGRISFSIRRGVTAGEYRVRLDDAEGRTGSVLSRAEVTFAMPAAGVVAQALPAADSVTRPPAIPPLPPGGTAPASPPAPGAPPEPGRTVTASADGLNPARGSEAGLVVVPQISTAAVTRGDSLWRISRRIYGSGLRYTVIYDANQRQIRNPDRIYPGQVFVVPEETARP
jgi:nucleoid-associated protein YgaU